MSDSDVVVQPVATPPKVITADDLLSMYAEEGDGEGTVTESSEVEVEPEVSGDQQEEPSKPEEAAPDPEEGIIKATHNGEELKIPEDATIEIEVAGKLVTVRQADAVKAIQQQAAFEQSQKKRLFDVSKREKEFEAKFNDIRGKARGIVEAAAKADFFSCFKAIAKIGSEGSQLDEIDIEMGLLEQMGQFKDAYQDLTPEQKKQFWAERKANHYKEKNQSYESEKVSAQQLTQIEAEVEALREEVGATPEEFWQTYKLITDNLVSENGVFKTTNDIKPRDVVQQIVLNRQVRLVYEAAKSTGLEDEEVIDELIAIKEQHPDWTAEDLANLITQSGVLSKVSKESVENLNRKVAKGATPSKANSTKKQKNNTEGYDEDDLEFLNRHRPKQYKPINYR